MTTNALGMLEAMAETENWRFKHNKIVDSVID
jgi:hypothetical protein